MEVKNYTILGKDGKYYGNDDRWYKEEDIKPKYLYNSVEEAKERISWAKAYANSYEKGCRELAREFLANEPVIEEVIVDMEFVEHDMTKIPITGGWI